MIEKLQDVLDDKGTSVQRVEPETSVLEAVRTMNRAQIGSVLVTRGDEIVGVFSERDVLRRVVDPEKDPKQTTVAQVMTTTVVVVDPEMTVPDAMAVITERRCRHLPVVQEGELRGIVSIGDLTRWVTRNQEHHISHERIPVAKRSPRLTAPCQSRILGWSRPLTTSTSPCAPLAKQSSSPGFERLRTTGECVAQKTCRPYRLERD